MSKEIKYYCDLCKEQHNKDKELFSIYYDSKIRNDDNTFGNYALYLDLDKSGKHICGKCIIMLKRSKQNPI